MVLSSALLCIRISAHNASLAGTEVRACRAVRTISWTFTRSDSQKNPGKGPDRFHISYSSIVCTTISYPYFAVCSSTIFLAYSFWIVSACCFSLLAICFRPVRILPTRRQLYRRCHISSSQSRHHNDRIVLPRYPRCAAHDLP